jgi:outer membrane protein assembly factor BamB
VPKDLETIILKCLEKDPAKRYQTARGLADDLRAFLDNRPIQARRISVFEQGRRWAVKHRRSALLMAGAAVASALLIFLGTGIFQQYQAWQRGGLLFWTDEQVLVGELTNARGEPVLPRFTVPNEEPLPLQAGAYELRLWGRGFLDLRSKVLVDRGPWSAYQLGLEEQRLCEPIRVSRCFEVVAFGDKSDLLLLSETGVTRRDVASGKDLWTVVLGPAANPRLTHFRWNWKESGYPSGRGGYDYRPRLVKPLPDLNGDGIGDLVWASQRQSALLALSGKDGTILWLTPDPLPEDQRLSTNHDYFDRGSRGSIVGVPVAADVDGDGVTDLVAAFISWDRRDRKDGTKPAVRWVEAFAGRTGKSLWRRELDSQWFIPADGSEVPAAARWFPGPGTSSGGGWHSDSSLLYEFSFSERVDSGPALPYPPGIVKAGEQVVVLTVAGSRLVGLNLLTGEPAWTPHDLGLWPVRPPQVGQLLGDGSQQLILLEPGRQPAKLNDDHLILTALNLRDRQQLWRTPFRGYWRSNWYEQPFWWPWIYDLDGDDKDEIIIPTAERTERSLRSGLQLIEGASGQVRWQRPIVLSSGWGRIQQVDRFVTGPDIDGDGARDIFAASLDAAERAESINFPIMMAGLTDPDKDASRPVVVVEALSGRTGEVLWWSRQPMNQGTLASRPGPSLGPLHWWYTISGGAPQLVVSYVPDTPHEGGLPPTTLVFSALTGELQRRGQDLREADVADFDGDGFAELFAFRPTTPPAFDDGGTIDIIRGRSAESWRLLGGRWQVAGDFDKDGVADLITDQRDLRGESKYQSGKAARERRVRTEPARLRAVSGASGELLWETDLKDPWSTTDVWQVAFPAAGPQNDLDGDGAGDILAIPSNGLYVMEAFVPFGPHPNQRYSFSPLLAISGRTGKRLWTADVQINMQLGCQFHECRDLNGDGRPEVIFVSRIDLGYDRQPGQGWSSNDGQLWLIVLDGRTGKVRWSQPLNERGSNPNDLADVALRPVFAELTGDAVEDIVISAGLPLIGETQVRAFSGSDGTPLWNWASPASKPKASDRHGWPMLSQGDLDCDGHPEVVILNVEHRPAQANESDLHAVLHVLDGETGKPRWSWSAPVDHGFHQPDSNPERQANVVTPLVVRLNRNQRAVCVWTFHYQTGGQVVLLDAQGKELQKAPIQFAFGGEARGAMRIHNHPASSYQRGPNWAIFRVWAHDLDNDGTDELLWFVDNELQAVRPDLKTVLWTWPLRGEANRIVKLIDGIDQQPGTIIVQSDQRVQCLNAATGQPLVTCVGTGQLVGVLDYRSRTRSRFLFDHGREVVSCSEGELHGAQPPTRPRETRIQGEDHRVARPLPWQRLDFVPRWLLVRPLPQSLLGAILVSAGFAMLVVVMPGTLIVWGLRQRHWPSVLGGLVWFGLALVGVCVSVIVQYGDEAQWSVQLAGWWGYLKRLTTNAVLVSLVGLPTVAFAAALIVCLWRGYWVRLLGLILACVALSVLLGWIILNFAAEPLEVGQHYSWQGWYTIWPAGPYAGGCLIVIGAVSYRLVRLARGVIAYIANRRVTK